MNWMKRGGRSVASVVVSMSIMASTSWAQLVETYQASVPAQPTNWSETLNITRFDPAGKLLVSVEVDFVTEIAGTARAENLDANPADLTLSFSANLDLIRPGGGVIVSSEPMETFQSSVSAFDGTIDFAGTSGVDNQVSATDTQSTFFVGTAMDSFIGPAGNPGTIELLATAAGDSEASGAGNLVASFLTNASAQVVVRYNYFSDCDGNGVADEEDLSNGPDCNENDIPDACEPDCDFDGLLDECEADCNENDLPDDCEDLGDCDGDGIYDPCEEDCDASGVPDDCENHGDCDGDGVPDPCEFDCHGNGIPDECEWFFDCDEDGLPDECEEDCDGSFFPDDCEGLADCDADGIPDACEEDCDNNGVVDDCDWFTPDCDSNGIPDSCDIASGAPDGNHDGVPDVCQCGDIVSYCSASTNSTGVGTTLDYSGTTSLNANDLWLTVQDAPPGQFGLFFYGPNQTSNPVGMGVKCVGGATQRLHGMSTQSGSAAYLCDFAHPMFAAIAADSTWNFQFAYRDASPAGGAGFNFSDALSVTFCP